MEFTRAEKALRLFNGGYTCSQSTVLAFEDLLPVGRSELLRLSSSFGAGMAGMHDVCGAMTGTFIVTGLLYGFDAPYPGEAMRIQYTRLRGLANEFRSYHGSILCRELNPLHLLRNPDGTPKNNPRCAELITFAVYKMEAQLFMAYLIRAANIAYRAEQLAARIDEIEKMKNEKQ